jgi:hypothetical protein
MVCLSEKFVEMDDDRKALYRHVIPPANATSMPLDPFEPLCPSQLLTRITPRCADLDPWVTLAIVNWTDRPREMVVTLDDAVIASMAGSTFLIFDFFAQRVLGLYAANETIRLDAQAPHASKVLRITPWDDKYAILAGTDLHFSGGGVEIVSWQASATVVEGQADTNWDVAVRVTAAFPGQAGLVVGTTTVQPGEQTFRIEKP